MPEAVCRRCLNVSRESHEMKEAPFEAFVSLATRLRLYGMHSSCVREGVLWRSLPPLCSSAKRERIGQHLTFESVKGALQFAMQVL